MIGLLMFGGLLVFQDGSAGEPTRCADDRIVASPAICENEASPGPYMVFFRWGGSVIDRDGADILDKVVESASGSGATYRLEITGFSDRSGPAAVNRRISRSRAALVRDELVKRGIGRDRVILAEPAGETDLLVPTADGVREAQNRRVEIHFHRID
ncbi:OmpA family protein [Sphingomicrobium aestuariivivum]|uniref:OmpA family protein n=1 Tax=Sphingomicrobium aestuariivivum TaxID=1582356 RepID=UPI001FD6DFD5|nr:OmpA family protein [Sphingomicrobium aestuariivivum]MCJ8191786.1 OmpA family protein [Sphingomicrobium aestuariivivum]